MTEIPDRVELSVDEALLLVVALEDAASVLDRLMRRQPLQMTDLIAPLAGIEEQLRLLDSKLGWTEGGHDAG